MLIDGKWFDNITCKRCRMRHPAHVSCEAAREIANVARIEREEYDLNHSDIDIDTAVAIAQMSEDALLTCANRMEEYGGGFASKLAALYYVADGSNRRLLLNAFGHVFLNYREA